jgi:hypothetical protein
MPLVCLDFSTYFIAMTGHEMTYICDIIIGWYGYSTQQGHLMGVIALARLFDQHPDAEDLIRASIPPSVSHLTAGQLRSHAAWMMTQQEIAVAPTEDALP